MTGCPAARRFIDWLDLFCSTWVICNGRTISRVSYALTEVEEEKTVHNGVSRLFGQQFAAPISWVGVEDCLRERPRTPPWVHERALTLSVYFSAGSARTRAPAFLTRSKSSSMLVPRSVTESAPGSCCVERASLAFKPGLVTTMAPLPCTSCRRS